MLREADIVRCSLNIAVVKPWECIERFNFKKSGIEKLVKRIFQENWHISELPILRNTTCMATSDKIIFAYS